MDTGKGAHMGTGKGARAHMDTGNGAREHTGTGKGARTEIDTGKVQGLIWTPRRGHTWAPGRVPGHT